MNKFLAALAATLMLATAGAASAQDQRRGDSDREWRRDDDNRDGRGRNDQYRDWRGRGGGEIVVRDLRGRTHRFDRNDREFVTLIRSPFGFRPGVTYVYTDDCRRGECQVYLYEPGQRRARSHLWAPTLNDPRYFRTRYNGRRDGDGRWNDDDRDYDRDRDRDRDWDRD